MVAQALRIGHVRPSMMPARNSQAENLLVFRYSPFM
jgi:hypothetical protein